MPSFICFLQVYDRRIKPKYFIGQFTLALIPLLPWVADIETALEDVQPARDYEDSIDLKKIGQLLLTRFMAFKDTQHQDLHSACTSCLNI